MRFLLVAATSAFLVQGSWCPGEEEKPSSCPHTVPVTRLETKKALEAYKFVKPRLPLPPLTDKEKARGKRMVNQVRMRVLHLDPEVMALWPKDYADKAMSLTRDTKRRLLWVTSRVNNCLY